MFLSEYQYTKLKTLSNDIVKSVYVFLLIIITIYLLSGSTRFEGNVYVLGHPVCDDHWSENNAKVICKSLGCSSHTVAVPKTESFFGMPSSRSDYILDNVKCNGQESHIGSCDYVTVHNCKLNEAAGVKCIDPKDIQLKGGLKNL